MKMIQAVVRPERSDAVLDRLNHEGFRAVTKYGVLGRGKQRGLKVADVYYDEIPKEMLVMVVEDADVQRVSDLIVEESRSHELGSFGDGKVFVLPVERAITVSSGKDEL